MKKNADIIRETFCKEINSGCGDRGRVVYCDHMVCPTDHPVSDRLYAGSNDAAGDPLVCQQTPYAVSAGFCVDSCFVCGSALWCAAGFGKGAGQPDEKYHNLLSVLSGEASGWPAYMLRQD